jgi:hypothetical protein
VKIRNTGAKVVSSCPVKYSLNGGSVRAGVINGALLPDSTATFEFTETMDLSLTGTALFKTWCELPGDQNKSNDTLTYQLETISSLPVQSGYVQSFDSWTKCNSAPVCELYSCPLEQEWKNLPNTLIDDHDWRTLTGTTPTSATGPDVDHTTGTSSGRYLYIEPTMNCLNKTASLITPVLDLSASSHPVLSLWYHAYGADIGSLHADIFDGNIVTEEVVSPISGNKGNQWKELRIDLLAWAGKMISVRIRGVTSCKDKGDLAIDDVMLSEFTGMLDYQGITGNLQIFPNPSSGEVTIVLKNAGSGTWDFRLLNMMGKPVRESLQTTDEGTLSCHTEIADLPKGVYLVELASGEKVFRGKLIKW